MNATSMKADPNIVYRKNLSEAYLRCSPPHTPIMKNIGSSTSFEEHEEQDQVLRHERAGHADLQDQHQDEERLGVARVGHVVPAVDHHEERDRHRQDVERQADAVDADRVVGVDHRDPLGVDEELQLRPASL